MFSLRYFHFVYDLSYVDVEQSSDKTDEASQNNSPTMPLRESNHIIHSVVEPNVGKVNEKKKVGKENTKTFRLLTCQSIENDRNNMSQLSVSVNRSQNNMSSSDSSSSEEINFVPDITVYPMVSKIEFETVSVDELPIFSPPNKRGKSDSVQEPLPDFFRILEPKLYAEIRKQNADETQSQPFNDGAAAGTSQPHKKPQTLDESVADSIVKHTLNTNHLHFPGKCSFVSLIRTI